MVSAPTPLLLPVLVALPLLAALTAAIVPRGRYPVGAAASLAGFVICLVSSGAAISGAPLEFVLDWAPSMGVAFALRADGLAIAFAALVTGIGTLVFVYAGTYLARTQARERAAPILLLFQGAMLGAVLADDFVLLFVFWELTSLASFLLVAYDHERAHARRAALQGLLVTIAGGLALLAGIVLLAITTGTLRIAETVISSSLRDGGAAVTVAMSLVIVGAFAKSAQFPLHFWLPNAMAAPTPVSAYLHSATMVKLGVYLLARLDPAFGARPDWMGILVVTGTATMLGAALLALRERDLKRILAYSTVVALGTLVMLVGLQMVAAAYCFALVLFVHALYKAALFFVAGIVDHETGVRDAARLGGLARRMPVTAAVAGLAAASMAGLPPFLGFVGKEAVYDAQLGAEFGGLLVAASLLVNGAIIAVAALVALRPFFGAPTAAAAAAHDPPPALLGPPMLAGVAGCVVGIAPWLLEPIVGAVARSLVPGAAVPDLGLWHGWTPELALSLATLAVGIVAYRGWSRAQPILADIELVDRIGPERAYDHAVAAVIDLAKRQTGMVQAGSLRDYAGLTIGIVSAALLLALLLAGGLAIPAATFAAGPVAIAALLIAVAVVAAIASDHALASFMAAGVAGFGAAALFLVGGAPDLAFTQAAVEALAIVLFLAVLGRLPLRGTDPRVASERRRDAIIAVAFGSAITLLLLAVAADPPSATLDRWFGDNSVPAANGRNVVNVIIVDFRALDTLGEIAVLAFAALGAIALIRGSRRLAS
jgi:multicomponent Na+:H+ antiporter subunit A